MQATVTYLLTEQAQRAQMAATGQPVARKQTMTIEITAEDLPLCRVAEDGSLSIDPTVNKSALVATGWNDNNTEIMAPALSPDILADIRRGVALINSTYSEACEIASQYVLDTPALECQSPWNSYHIQVPHTVLKSKVLELSPRVEKKYDSYGICSSDLSPAAQDALRERYSASQAASLAMSNAAIDAFFADPASRLSGPSYMGSDIRLAGLTIIPSHERYAELYAEITRRNQADADARAAVEATKEQVKLDYIAAWIAEYADVATREQYDDGLLSRSTAVALIADAAFADAGVPEKAEYSDATCQDNDCPCGTKDLDSLPRRIYPAWKALKATLPEGYSVSFSRVRACLKDDWDGEGESAAPSIYLAMLSIPHGPFTFTRTFQLG